MDFNTLFFGGLIVVSLSVFFYLSRFRASASQRNRDNKIDWTSRRYWWYRWVFLVLVLFVSVAAMVRMFS